MNDDDWLSLLRCAEDRGLTVVAGNQRTGAMMVCGVCSIGLRCGLHPKSGHKQPRPWPED